VTYSKGPEMVSVPAIGVGSTESQVQQAIQSAGLRWAKGADVAGAAAQPPGTFVSSDPAAGMKVPAGSVVTYHLSKALGLGSSPATTSSVP
jgi:serine/threonine-protein kinase